MAKPATLRFPFLWAFLMLCGLFWGTGCGYQVRRNDVSLGGVKAVAGSEQRIFVPVVDNWTTSTGFEPTITSSLRDILAAVPGVRIVNTPEEAQFFLLSAVSVYRKTAGNGSYQGTQGTENIGGISKDRTVAVNIRLAIEIRAQLVEKNVASPTLGPHHIVWSRTFSSDGQFPASQRYVSDSIAPGSYAANNQVSPLTSASSSAAQINLARESLQTKILADAIAHNVVDQVVQDF